MKTLLLVIVFLTFSPQSQDATQFTAVVTKSDASFSIPVQTRARWNWRLAETPDNKQEYRMDVTVKNDGRQYTFGFYLWKRAGASANSGSLDDLLSAGQTSLFERTQSRLMTIIRGADIRVKGHGDHVTISVRGNKELKRLFSSQPTEAVVKIKYPNEPEISQTVPIVYQ